MSITLIWLILFFRKSDDVDPAIVIVIAIVLIIFGAIKMLADSGNDGANVKNSNGSNPRPTKELEEKRAAALKMAEGLRQKYQGKTGLESKPNNGASPYKILGITDQATPDEVKEAYRKTALLYHPDKVATLAPEFQELAHVKMKEINAAYEAIKEGKTLSPIAVNADEEMDREALAIIVEMGRASTSVLQRRLSIGYGRAAKILDEFERRGYIEKTSGAQPRKVLPAAYEALRRG